ncbi:hypothetical protein, partial [Vibrio cholerae]|uniref:hypothetical protein n=1 Tax=Vibrio cholerae TaxID=666 RepID=UPI001C11FD45
YFGNKVEDYVVTFGSWFLLLAPGIWMYSRAKTRREKIRKVVQTIKESGFYSPEKGYEGLSLTQGAYLKILRLQECLQSAPTPYAFHESG